MTWEEFIKEAERLGVRGTDQINWVDVNGSSSLIFEIEHEDAEARYISLSSG